mgnify:CR=1 FL=1
MAILRIENGLIMDEAVGGIPIERRIVEPGTEAHCVRTLAGLSGPIGVTVHNTGNATPTADARAHASYAAERGELACGGWLWRWEYGDGECGDLRNVAV